MGSITIADFKFGMDRRRTRASGVPGTLWLGENVHLSRGGDIERSKKFVPTFVLPANTFGLATVRGQLFVFGSQAPPLMPSGVGYQQLSAPDASPMVRVLDAKPHDGKLYVIAQYASGAICHFYNGSRVTQWDTIADSQTDFNTLVAALTELVNNDPDVNAIASQSVMTITAQVPGVDFTIGQGTVNNGVFADQQITLSTIQPNVPATAEVRATGTAAIIAGSFGPGANRIDQVLVNGVPLMAAPVNWQVSNSSTAGAVVTQINNKTVDHGYSASNVGATITITAPPGTGAAQNGFLVTTQTAGTVLMTTTPMAGGVTRVEPVAKIVTASFIGTFEPADAFTLTINGRSYSMTGRAAGTGTSVFVHKHRVWSPANSLERYSKLDDPTDWTDAGASSGAGFLNIASESESNERLVGAASYGQSRAAIFARDATYIYLTNTDAEQIAIDQVIPNTGALSGRAIIPYGNIDVYYLDSTGIRSLRVNSQSGQAYTTDIGGTIDPFILEYMGTLAEAVPERAVAVLGPESRYMLALGERIFVLSAFPGYKVQAWSYYSPGFTVTDFARTKSKLYARAGNTIYLYGGADGNTYPDAGESIATVKLPFVRNRDQAGVAMLTGFDISCTGEWLAHACPDPDNEDARILIGRVSGTTHKGPHIALPGRTSHVAFDFVCDKAGPASISSITLYDDAEEAR
jgi:hypothetical protein